MTPARFRYGFDAVLGDYLRAAAGCAVCLAPILLVAVNAVTVVLAGLAALFAVFGAKTAIRHRTEYALDDDGLRAVGPFGRSVAWDGLRRMKIAYYATRRDRQGGWMQMTLGGADGAVVVDSNLDGFLDVARRAARAAERNGLELTHATVANLRSLGIEFAGHDEAAAAEGPGAAGPGATA